ncbi:ABC transporter ATP-binding protein [Chthonobacter albigriseus]|uniref:ABC transporter ATP-binding protein n=1 Tax=Chthonobacter albigriseus TaxID=1683161 RepID=UPI0015EEA658|nr:ABC transporter ATP-binding protein [Chthonobacter albigriseus]
MRDRLGGTGVRSAGGSERAVSTDPVVTVSGLTVDFETERGTYRAVNDVSFTIGRGEIVGLVGESGSGKSVSALALLGLVPKPGRLIAGQALFDGRDILAIPPREMQALRGRRIAYISQTPRAALNPSYRIGDQLDITLRACAPELTGTARSARALDLLSLLGFHEPARVAASFPHQLSGGMCQRVCIAMALAGSPDLLIADEPTTALDVAVQMQILAYLYRLRRETGVSILLVSHDLALVRSLADRVIVLYGGEIQEVGSVDAILAKPFHPYSQALLASVPDPSRRTDRLAYIEGYPAPVPPDATGCRFAGRCAMAVDRCRTERPNLRPAGADTRVRCHFTDVEGGRA